MWLERRDAGTVIEDVLRRSGRLLVLRAGQYGLAFLGTVIITRELGPTGRAAYALPLALTAIVVIVVHLSIESSAVRLLGRREATLAEIAGFFSAATLVMSAIAVPAAIGIGLAVRTDLLAGATTAGVVLAALTTPFALAGQMAAALLFQLGALRAYGVIVAASGGLQLALAVVFAIAGRIGSELALLITMIVMATSAIVMSAAVARHAGWRALAPRTSRRVAGAALAAGLRMHAASIALFLNLQVDLVLLGALVDPREVGLYSLAATLAALVFVATSTMALAGLQIQTQSDEPQAVEYTAQLTRQALAVSTFLAVVAAACAYPFVAVAYGSAWLASVPPFVVLTLAAIALGVEGPARNLLMRLDRPTTISAAAIVALAVNVALNLVLIPRAGIMGAALASVGSYWCAALLMVWLVRRRTGVPMSEILAWPRRDEPMRRPASTAAALVSGPWRGSQCDR